MKRFGGLFGGKAGSSASKSMTALDEPKALADAMAAATFIMNDEVEKAESELSKGTSPFHKLGLATAIFLRATLGFEKEIMEQASARLADAEETASECQRRAVRDPSTAHQSAIYPAGAEYALCHAESQLMSAVIGVLNESLTESLRGFYKLRKAFTTLYELSEAEKRYLKAHNKMPTSSQASLASTGQLGSKTTSDSGEKTPAMSSGVMTPNPAEDSDDDLDFVDAEDDTYLPEKPNGYQGHLDQRELEKLSMDDTAKAKLNGTAQSVTQPSVPVADSESAAADAENDLDFRTITTDPIDLFIHSGTAMCFGLLQLLLSLIPPAFAKILSLFSFRGDREAGLRMLWSATKFKHNINGAMAGLATLAYHNGALAQFDILTKDALPEARLKSLLRGMRELYPNSKLWQWEESRMLAADHNLEKAVEITKSDDSKPGLKQLEALRIFERSLNLMYMHRYEECAQSFVECVGMNNWSHALYYYIAGCCYVELYRTHKDSDPKLAEGYAASADKYLHEVPQHMGKKRLMGRQLPFDTFVNRKVMKWDHRAKLWGCKFVEAAGVAPVEEMTYFWSGYKRMNEKQLHDSLERIAWYENATRNPNFDRESVDERAVLSLLKAACLRFSGRIPEAKATISDSVFCHDAAQIRACDHADTYALPVGHYEMAVCLWEEAGRQDGDKATLQGCWDELAKVETAGSFDLEARVGMKVTTARETLKRCGVGQ